MDKPNQKEKALETFIVSDDNALLTTNQGLKVNDNQNTLKAGERGPSLLEDFIFREKITHFDHERIPERIVHARGEGAFGYFQVYESMAKVTKAKFLQNPGEKTPVFVRFSTVAGSRGSADTVRDVRGFAVKFYTEEGNYDLVGNNVPIFFIQDALKFPDLVHSFKPEPDNEMPQAATAHDTFWDFVSVMPESMHMIMWIMSDRTIPRSLRMMEGFGVHTFRFINEAGESTFVKFHWKPLLGVHSLLWDEAQKIVGFDADFHRRDLWEAIEAGNFPEWEFGVQLFSEAEAEKFDFDILDATKIVPEELVPVKRIGKLVLNRNPDNFFAETEQVAFHPGHVVPGIDFSNDPLLQGRLFSYTDTQLSRLGGPNFHEIPINRPICPFHNNQRDGIHRTTINKGKVAYEPNTLANGYPREATLKQGGFASYPEEMHGRKVRVRAASFADHFSQARLFWRSQSDVEKAHLTAALQFELAKVNAEKVRENVVNHLMEIDEGLATAVAQKLNVQVSVQKTKPAPFKLEKSAALSMVNTVKNTIQSRVIAVLAADGVDVESLMAMKKILVGKGAQVKILGPHLGELKGANGQKVKVDHTFETMPSVLFDAFLLPNGEAAITQLAKNGLVLRTILEAYKHAKTIGVFSEAQKLLTELQAFANFSAVEGVIVEGQKMDVDAFAKLFVEAVAKHRHWNRAGMERVPV